MALEALALGWLSVPFVNLDYETQWKKCASFMD
jgi:hypothetical protein